jgi:hypothetical protein
LDNIAPTAFADLRVVGLPFSGTKPIILSFYLFHNILARAVETIRDLMEEEFTLQRGLKNLGGGKNEVNNEDPIIQHPKMVRQRKEKKRADGIKNSGLYRLQVWQGFFFVMIVVLIYFLLLYNFIYFFIF